MNKQRLLELAGINEVGYQSGNIGQVSRTFFVPLKEDAYRLADLIHSPPHGWHSKVESGLDGNWHVTITVNVDPKNFI